MNEEARLGDQHNWQETVLWTTLENRKDAEANAVKATMERQMPDIQSILAQAHTDPPDFTLHDAGHAFRVAERMAELLTSPQNVLDKLSVYELALLLLSAYLHDIGMTPERRKVILHRNYLITGEKEIKDGKVAQFTDKEFAEFQEWLDDHSEGMEPPIPPERILKAEELVTYYCRHKHNDWSEEWIRQSLSKEKLGNYTHWVEDLVALCRSHHEGYDELAQGKFNPTHVPGSAEIVHRRYLAAMLRLADILEFDPERTPEVIFRHRSVASGSRIYWWKDHDVTLVPNGASFTLKARPSNARAYRAVELMMDDIDRELALCRRLAEAKPFEKCEGVSKDLPHKWEFASTIYRGCEIPDDSYEYIDGSFRPDTQKLLQLLSGTQLYGTEMAAIRELLQNAFDAVREEIARKRLSAIEKGRPDPGDDHARLHTVELKLKIDGDKARLICTDDGVGMTKSIIKDHFLVSGAARRHDIVDMERRCKEHGILLGRTGQFGIGALSYFMLADHVIIRTRRSQQYGQEPNGWIFETDGVGSFGELRKDSGSDNGTEVALHLRKNMNQDELRQFAEDVRAYLRETLLRIPCRFEFSVDIPGFTALEFDPGWVRQRRTSRSRSSAIYLNPMKSRMTSSFCRGPSRKRSMPSSMHTTVRSLRYRLQFVGWSRLRVIFPIMKAAFSDDTESIYHTSSWSMAIALSS